MELKHYLQIVKKRWWLAAIAAGVTLLFTFVYTAQQPWIYQSEATFVVRPRLLEGADVVKATDTLIRGAEINSTFAGIARSEIIQDRAKAAIGSSRTRGNALSVQTDVVAGTNILRITVSGRDAQVVSDYAGAVAEETVAYIDDLNDVYALAPLDEPQMAGAPAGPNKGMTNVLGGIVGIMLGVVLTFGVEYFSEPTPEVVSLEVLDPETGIYNEVYFRRRFDQEMSRARHTGQRFTLAMIQTTRGALAPGAKPVDPGEIVAALEPLVRPEDVLAHVGDGTYALIMAGMAEDEAEKVLADWAVATWPDTDGVPPVDARFDVSVGVCEYGADELPASVRAI